MVMSELASARPHPSAVIWHDLECGSYRADLPLWRELAGDAAPRRARSSTSAPGPAG